MPQRTGMAIGFLAVAASSGWAEAHHPAAEQSAGHERPASRVALEVSGGTFTLPYGRGTSFVATAAADVAIGEHVALGVRMPFVLVSLRGNGPRAGAGDVDLVGKVRLLGTENRSLSFGLGLEAPTGDAERGLGSGHFEVSAGISGAWAEGPWVFHGTVADAVSLEGDGGAAHVHEAPHEHGSDPHAAQGSFVSPHSEHELQYHAGVQHHFVPAFFANLAIGGATVLVPDRLGETVLVARPEVGLQPSRSLRLTTSLEVPFAGPRRFDWRASVGAELRF